MNVNATSQKLNAGTCPHGNPIGTCPICAGLSGGGRGLANNKVRQAGEMTYDQCYAIWQQMIKAKKVAEENKNLQKLDFNKGHIKTLSEKFLEKISHIKKIVNQPITIKNFVQIASLKTFVCTLNFIIKTTAFIRNVYGTVYQKFTDISDKISYVFGELKAKIQKLLSSNKNLKQKIKSLFKIFILLNIDNEEKKINEEKYIYKLKTTLSSIMQKYRKNEAENDKTD